MSQTFKLLTKKSQLLVLLIVACLLTTQVAFGQSEEPLDPEGWQQAVNLSQSGSTSNPILVVDSTESLYAFWKNSADGYYFSVNSGVEWRRSGRGNFPFATRAYTADLPPSAPTPLYDPAITADINQGMHSFWIDANENLEYSRYTDGVISNLESWSFPTTRDTQVVKVEAHTTERNELHIAYIKRGRGQNAGIYHQFSTNSGSTWSAPIQIYASSFFAQAAPDSSTFHFLENGSELAFVWNDAFTEQVFISKFSPDNSGSEGVADSWGTAQIIDGREASDSPDTVGPQKIKAALFDGSIHLFWVSGHDDDKCSLFSRRSSDSGETWTFPTKIFTATNICLTNFNVANDGSRLILHTFTDNNAQVRYYSGDSWSKPVDQDELLVFDDPITFRPVTSTCGYHFEVLDQNLVGLVCGIGATDDIWSTSIKLNELAPPEELPTDWTPSVQIVTDDKAVISPQVTTDADGVMHAFWVQNDQGYSDKPLVQQQGESIYYSKGEGVNWSAPVSVLASDGDNSNPSTIYYAGNKNLMVAWEDGVNQQILFSKVSAFNAVNWQDWSDPVVVPAPFANPSFPNLTSTNDGTLLLTYAVPYNENRGIYLVISEDQGETWSDPIALLAPDDAWDVIIDPQVVAPQSDRMHLAFINQLGTSGAPRNELYYVSVDLTDVEDGEVESTTPLLIENQLLENNNILSYRLDFDERKNFIHLIWQEWNETQPNLWSQFFWQNGSRTSEPKQVSGFGFPIGNIYTTHDSLNRLHLNQAFLEKVEGADQLAVYGWFFDSESNVWVLDSSTQVPEVSFSEFNTTLAAAIDAADQQTVLFSGYVVEEGRPEQGFFQISRKLDLPVVEGGSNAGGNGGGAGNGNNNAELPADISGVVADAAAEDEIEEEAVPEPRTLTEEQKIEEESSAISLFTSSNLVISSGILALSLTGIILLFVAGFYIVNFLRKQF